MSDNRSAGVRRLMKEYSELRAEKSPQYDAAPLEDNLFEWHFTIRGPSGTSFEHGVYHGRIILPAEYPFKPPSIIFMTPNGRFEVGKKICLSVTGHHPEFWRPAWGIRTVLLAVLSFMPTSGEGAIGALDYTDAERRALATQAMRWECPVCHIKMSDALPEPTMDEVEGDESKKRDIQESQDMLAQLNFAYEGPKKDSTPAATALSTPVVPPVSEPVEPAPVESAPVESVPVETAPVETAPVQPIVESIVPQAIPEPIVVPPSQPILAPVPELPEGLRLRNVATQPNQSTSPPVTVRPARSPSFLNPYTAAGLEDDFALSERLRAERKVLDTILAIVLGMLAWLISKKFSF